MPIQILLAVLPRSTRRTCTRRKTHPRSPACGWPSGALKVLKRGDEGNPVAGQLINDCLDRKAPRRAGAKAEAQHCGRRTERPSLPEKGPRLGRAHASLAEGTLTGFAALLPRPQDLPFETTIELKNDIDFIAKRFTA